MVHGAFGCTESVLHLYHTTDQTAAASNTASSFFLPQRKQRRIKMGDLDWLADRWSLSSSHSRTKKLKKRYELQTVEIKVRMDCEGCERKVEKAVKGMKGVTSIELDRKQKKLTVVGYVEAEEVVKRVRWLTGKKAEFWPYVPYSEVPHPYAPGVYDKKAPPGYVRNADPSNTLARADSIEEWFVAAFSDDNPNSCALMWMRCAHVSPF